jgi:O-methyltransferase involved in polyketide biosynthesis
MRKNHSSLTAAGIAIARAVESEKPVDERICYDPYARQFVQAWMYRLMGVFIKSGYAELRGPGVNGFLMARERYMDEVLLSSGYDSHLFSLFIWQGVTISLTLAGVDATLDFIVKNSTPGSAVVFDYLYQAVLESIQKQNEISNMRRYRLMTGEELTFGIPRGRIDAFLQALGFSQVKDVTTEELRSAYFSGKNANRKVVGGYGIVVGRV